MQMVGKDERRETGMPKGLEWQKTDTCVCIFSADAQTNWTVWTGLHPTATLSSKNHQLLSRLYQSNRDAVISLAKGMATFFTLIQTANQTQYLWIPHWISCWDCNSNIYNMLKIQWQEQRICTQLPFRSVLHLLSLGRMAYKIKSQQYVDDRAICTVI